MAHKIIACKHCGVGNNVDDAAEIDFKCRSCNRYTEIGNESTVRPLWEALGGKYPLVTASRAISLSNGIYKTANNSGGKAKHDYLSMTTGQKALTKAGYSGEVVDTSLIGGRVHGEKLDFSVAAAVATIRNEDPVAKSIYVVFRGSVGAGDIAGVSKEGKTTHRVDWQANINNKMEPAIHAPGLRVHSGFQDILSSYRDRVLFALRNAIRAAAGPYHVVITGHSQGAAHAILFSHWLRYVDSEIKFVCIPFSPPRVGDYRFARDFTARISERATYLPYDGWWTSSTFLMVMGEDPVVFQQKHAFSPENRSERDKVANKGILAVGKKAHGWERDSAVLEESYMHPKNLISISSNVPKFKLGWVDSRILDHRPKQFRNKVLDQFKRK